MSNPNQSPESPEGELSQFDVAWQPLLLAADAGLPLNPEDVKAMQTREACLKIADYIDAVGEGKIDTDDLLAHASALAQYYEGARALKQLGVVAHAQTKRPAADYLQPAIVAEYVGGQWVDALDRPAPLYKQIMRKIEEIRQQEPQANGISVLSNRDLTPNVRNWMIMRSFVNMTHHFLAVDLGRPVLPPLENEDQEQQ